MITYFYTSREGGEWRRAMAPMTRYEFIRFIDKSKSVRVPRETTMIAETAHIPAFHSIMISPGMRWDAHSRKWERERKAYVALMKQTKGEGRW